MFKNGPHWASLISGMVMVFDSVSVGGSQVDSSFERANEADNMEKEQECTRICVASHARQVVCQALFKPSSLDASVCNIPLETLCLHACSRNKSRICTNEQQYLQTYQCSQPWRARIHIPSFRQEYGRAPVHKLASEPAPKFCILQCEPGTHSNSET